MIGNSSKGGTTLCAALSLELLVATKFLPYGAFDHPIALHSAPKYTPPVPKNYGLPKDTLKLPIP